MIKLNLPAALSRANSNSHKNDFGHVLVLAGCSSMLGAGALCSLAAMRSGAGLVTWGIPQSLNLVAQEKASNVVMTLPLAQTKEATISLKAFKDVKNFSKKVNVIALGPGLGRNLETQKFILKVIESLDLPIVLDADGLNALVGNLKVLKKRKALTVLTPHLGEFVRLILKKKESIEKDRRRYALEFAKENNCILVLKGHHSLVVFPDGELYENKTGNVGMATAGSGDVLTGIISAFIAQGISLKQAANSAVYVHGLAGDLAAKKITKVSLIASDLIDYIPAALKILKPKF